MSEKEYLKMDIESIDNAIDKIYEAKDNLLDVDDFSNKDFSILTKTIDILEQLKNEKENKLIHENEICFESIESGCNF